MNLGLLFYTKGQSDWCKDIVYWLLILKIIEYFELKGINFCHFFFGLFSVPYLWNQDFMHTTYIIWKDPHSYLSKVYTAFFYRFLLVLFLAMITLVTWELQLKGGLQK